MFASVQIIREGRAQEPVCNLIASKVRQGVVAASGGDSNPGRPMVLVRAQRL
jgi:hypothetical protein